MRQILVRRSYKTYSILCNCPPKHFLLPEAVSMHPARAAGQRCSRQQAASLSWGGPTGRASNLLCCSMCCLTESSTTASTSLEIFDNHCRTAETFGAVTETGFCAPWRQPPHTQRNSLPWCSGCLASKAPATVEVQTRTSVHK